MQWIPTPKIVLMKMLASEIGKVSFRVRHEMFCFNHRVFLEVLNLFVSISLLPSSGGPLLAERSGRDVQVGVVSFGSGCGKDSPGVYARVSKASDWISKTIAASLELSDLGDIAVIGTSPGREGNTGISTGSGGGGGGGGGLLVSDDTGGSLLEKLKDAMNMLETEVAGLSTVQKAVVIAGAVVVLTLLLMCARACCCRSKSSKRIAVR